MRDRVAGLRKIWIQPNTCNYGGGAVVIVHGTDTEPSSSTYEQRVRLVFQADLRSRSR
jgi:hypothetical protein